MHPETINPVRAQRENMVAKCTKSVYREAEYCENTGAKFSKAVHSEATSIVMNSIIVDKPACIEATLLNTWFVGFIT